jgi:rhodanese-related sulfurtransferase
MKILELITPEQAQILLDEKAVLVDVREAHEQAMERIPTALELPLSRLAHGMKADLPKGRPPIFLCASGMRTTKNSQALADGPGYCLAGGIAAWKRAGYATERG